MSHINFTRSEIMNQLSTISVNDVFESVLREAGYANGLEMNQHVPNKTQFITYTNPSTQEVIRYYNYDFGFNTALSSFLARDKVFCHQILKEKGVPSVPHLIFDPNNQQVVTLATETPSVLKPVAGGGGKDIFFIHNQADLLKALRQAPKGALALSPYIQYDIEYRITVLDDQVLLTYGKTKGENNQNNLSAGGGVVETPEKLIPILSDLAIRATKALGLRCTNVDIIIPQGGEPQVLEVNNSVALKRVAKASPEFYLACIEAYTELIKQAMQEQFKGVSNNEGMGEVIDFKSHA